jgi:hypothetical protein
MRVGGRRKDPVIAAALGQPRLLDAAQLAARDYAVEALIAAAPSSPEAWEALGPRTKTEAEMARDARVQELTDALRERWLAVRRGRALVEQNGVQPGYRERFLELHRQRLELRWALDACVFAHAAEDRRRARARLCDEEVSAALGGAWPDEYVQAAMHALNTSLADGDVMTTEELCMETIDAAVSQVYGAAE